MLNKLKNLFRKPVKPTALPPRQSVFRDIPINYADLMVEMTDGSTHVWKMVEDNYERQSYFQDLNESLIETMQDAFKYEAETIRLTGLVQFGVSFYRAENIKRLYLGNHRTKFVKQELI